MTQKQDIQLAKELLPEITQWSYEGKDLIGYIKWISVSQLLTAMNHNDVEDIKFHPITMFNSGHEMYRVHLILNY